MPDVTQSNSIPAGAQEIELQREGIDGRSREIVCIERALVLNAGNAQLLTMRTPQGEAIDREWAIGFLASEGIISDFSEIKSITVKRERDQTSQPAVEWDTVKVELWRGADLAGASALSRTHEMRPSCGLCGVKDARALVKGLPQTGSANPTLTLKRAAEFTKLLMANQPLFQVTGACHGCGIFGADGELWAAREDIGRHNAVDKAIGACLESGTYLNQGIAVLSGRAGYELVIKCLRVGIPTILSVGAASDFAIEIAKAANATLIGFIDSHGEEVRRAHVYADSGRLIES